MKLFLTFSLVTLTMSNVFAKAPSDLKKACVVLAKNIDKPSLPTQRISLGSVINPFIPPEVYSECTNTYDTGVPDLGNCHMEDGGSSSVCLWTPFGDVCTDVPNAPRTVCSNIIACNTYKTHKRFNVCEVAFTLKVPNFIAEPINKYIDSAYNTIESTRNELRSALPLACVPDEMKNSVTPDYGQTLADAVTAEIRSQLEDRLRQEGEQWLARTGIETILASIPTGGIAGPAALGTNIADFIITAKNIADDYVQIKELKTFAEDMNFEISCHADEWSDL